MANEEKSGMKTLAYIGGAVIFVVILIGLVPGGWIRRLFSETNEKTPDKELESVAGKREVATDATPDTNYAGENKCVLRNSRGEEITISSKENNELFQRYCRDGSTEPAYLYNNYWYPYSYWYPRYYGRRWFFVHPRGGHGIGKPVGQGSGIGGGTGGITMN